MQRPANLSARPLAASLYRRLPRHRRLRGLVGFRPKRLIQLRRMVPGADRVPLRVRSPQGVRLWLTSDPVDERIAEDVFGRHHTMYFPDTSLEPQLVVDIGAHHGHYSLLACVEYPDADVLAIEPSPRQAEVLRKNVEINGRGGRITVDERALAATLGDAVLHHDASGSWGDTLFTPAVAGSTATVRTATLAEMLGGRSPDLIKCNAEGAEFALVDQLPSVSPPPRELLLMVHPEHGDVESLRESVERLGYAIAISSVGDHDTWRCVPRIE